MKLLGLVLLLAVAAQAVPVQDVADEVEKNGALVSALIERAIAYFRDVIYYGDENLNLPVLDPFRVDHAEFSVPGDLISFDLLVDGANLTGMGDFRVDRADLSILSMRLDYDIVIPLISIRSAYYKMNGELITFLPLYGEGTAVFDIVDLRMVGNAQLGRSEDGRSIIIQDIGDATFSLGAFVARTTGYIGGGDIDKVINALLSDIVGDYVTRFSRQISLFTTPILKEAFNMVLVNLDTWCMLQVTQACPSASLPLASFPSE